MDTPIARKLDLLDSLSRRLPLFPPLQDWGRSHLSLTGEALSDWCQRAWWGLAAGELMRKHLHDRDLRPEALDLIDPSPWEEIEAAQKDGGVIIATAHLGPPKTAMHSLIEQRWRLLLWTHYAAGDMPSWLAESPRTQFLDPTDAATKPHILIQSAIHLRDGGALFGASDLATGSQLVVLEKFGEQWSYSLGIPMLAQRLQVPVFFVLALWKNHRVSLEITRMKSPEGNLGEQSWCRAWTLLYSAEIDKIISSSPENLRFLRGIFNRQEWDDAMTPAMGF